MPNQLDSVWTRTPGLHDTAARAIGEGKLGREIERAIRDAHGITVSSENARRHVSRCMGCAPAYSEPAPPVAPPLVGEPQDLREIVRAEVRAILTARDAAAPVVFDQTRFDDGATVFVSDWHIPLHHQRASAALIQFAEQNKGWLKRLVLGGDVFDGHGNSRHKQMARGEGHGGDLGDEIETGRGLVNALVECFDEATFMEGNHEARLWRVLAENKGIPAAPLVFEKLFEFYDYHHRLTVQNNRSLFVGRGDGQIEFIHGERYNQHTAAALLSDNMMRNSAQGHSHRPQAFWRRGKFAVVNGHLHDADKQQYMRNPEWTMGFTIFDHWDNGRKVNPYFVRITDDGSFPWNGKVYRG